MKTGYGFTEFENLKEFKTWLYNQKVSRTITRLQVHHMYLPDYSCWAKDNALRRQYNTKTYHMKTNGWADIAQHFSIFPDGHIVTGRSLNSTPVGIKGWNTNAICVEIYGNFDKGKDTMTNAQKNAVLGCYKIMAERFGIAININNIRPHAFFTAGGTYLGKYVPSKSAKTCPGTGFFGGLDKFESVFLAQVKAFNTSTLTSGVIEESKPSESYVTGVYKVKVNSLNVRQGPGTSYDVVGKIVDKGKYTIVEVKSGWGKLKSGAGWICLDEDYCELVQAAVTKKKMIKNISGSPLNIRSSADWNGKVVTTLAAGASVTYAEGPVTAANGSTKMYKTISGTYITASEKYVKIIEVEV